jgi:hypothetical protein
VKPALFAVLALSVAFGCGEAASLDAAGGSYAGGGDAAIGGAGGSGENHVSPCGETPDAPAFEIGTGETCFAALAPGAVVPRVGGPQGGFHVWGAFLCADCPHKVIVDIGLKLVGSEELVNEESERVVEVDSDQVAGLIALLPGTTENPSSSLPEGTDVRIVIAVRSMQGEPLHESEATVTLGDLELWKP